MASNKVQQARWQWLDDDDSTWQPYDPQTNHQIETAYNSGVGSVKLSKGPYFGQYENQIYDVIFDRSQHPTKCTQRNKQSNKCRALKRKSINKQSLLSINTQRQINKTLIGSYGFNQKVIDEAFRIFNIMYDENSNILTKTEYIIDAIMNIVQKHQLNQIQDDEKKDMQYQPQQQDPYHAQYEVGDYIEILNHNVWIPAEIIKTEPLNNNNQKGFVRNKMIYVEFEDTKTCKTMTMKLHGFKDKNKLRVLGSGLYSDAHSFAFEYAPNDKTNDAKNAKHPAAYINRECFKCKGTGIYKSRNSNNNNNVPKTHPCKKCNGTGTAHLPCNKCNGTGIFREAFCMDHDKCNGNGCGQCNDTGRYPLNDWKCNSCKGSGKIKPKCRTCRGTGIFKVYNKQKYDDNDEQRKCNKCVAGYFLSKVVEFTPKRDVNMAPHGENNKNVLRLYHATDKAGANGIIELGVMFRGKSGSYGAGIYFAASPQAAKERARQSGYLVIADVYVGKCKDQKYVSPEMDFMALNKMGYDSIRGTWSKQGTEYVVYNWDQVWVNIVVPFNKVDFSKLK